MTAVNTFGRQVILPLTNKSGGSVAAGDVVVINSANDEAFTTTTTASDTHIVGVAMASIANNAVGPVLLDGYAPLVNVNASVTRLHYGATYTVAKQATDAGASRASGTCMVFLTGGTTPSAYLYNPDLGGASLTNPMTTAGDIIVGGASGTPARLAAATNGMGLVLASGTPAWAWPPGYQFDRVDYTAAVTITATSDATANTVVTANAVSYDGSTEIWIEFYAPYLQSGTTAGNNLVIQINEGSTILGYIQACRVPASVSGGMDIGGFGRLRRTPSNASHTYSIRAWNASGSSAVVGAGAAGSDYVAGYIRQIKV
jgi:hypothetical protein